MVAWLLALKRTFRSFTFVFLLALSVAAILFVSLSDAADTKPPAGVCDLSGSEEGARIVSYLCENGFVSFSDVAFMEAEVAKGRLDCCVTLPQNLSALVQSDSIAGSVRFVRSPSSYMPDTYLNLASAALFRERAPYIAADGFAGTEITTEEVLEEYFGMFADGFAFAFDVVTADGAPIPPIIKAKSLTFGTVSVLLLVLVFSCTADLLNGDFQDISRRIGLGQSMKTALLPAAVIRIFLITLIACLSLLLSESVSPNGFCRQLLHAVPIYALLLLGVGILFSAFLPKREHMRLLVPILVIATLALCPIFTDTAILSPALSAVRYVLPSYWLWLIVDAPLAWLAAAIASLGAGVTALAVRYCAFEKYRWTKTDKNF